MAAPSNFRSAFNGFNREDVVHYIEYLNTRHATELNQLNSELELLRSQLAEQDHANSLRADLEEALATGERLTAEKEALAARCEELESKLAAVPAAPVSDPALELRCASLEQQLSAAVAARDTAILRAAQVSHEQELEAYRRAERTERVARERAEQIYRKANGALADATIRVEDAFTQIGELSDQVSAQLAQLQEAVRGSKQALSDASATLYTIRPDGNEG